MFNQVQRFTEKDVWLAKNAFESGTSNSVRQFCMLEQIQSPSGFRADEITESSVPPLPDYDFSEQELIEFRSLQQDDLERPSCDIEIKDDSQAFFDSHQEPRSSRLVNSSFNKKSLVHSALESSRDEGSDLFHEQIKIELVAPDDAQAT